MNTCSYEVLENHVHALQKNCIYASGDGWRIAADASVGSHLAVVIFNRRYNRREMFSDSFGVICDNFISPTLIYYENFVVFVTTAKWNLPGFSDGFVIAAKKFI